MSSPIRTLCLATPTVAAPPAFGRFLGELVFVFRAYGIECVDVLPEQPGMTIGKALQLTKADAILWMEGDIELKVEDALSLVNGLISGMGETGVMVPQRKSIDMAFVWHAAKRGAKLRQLDSVGLSYDPLDFIPEDVGDSGYRGEMRAVEGRHFAKVRELPRGVHAIRREYTRDFDTFGGNTWLLINAPVIRHIAPGVVHACREPEWTFGRMAKLSAPLVEGAWRERMKRDGIAITVAAFDERMAEIFEPAQLVLADGLRSLGYDATVIKANTYSEQRINIVFGAHVFATSIDVPEGSILYCAEQPAAEWADLVAREARLFRPSVVWSWAQPTTDLLKDRGLPTITVPLGHASVLEYELLRVDKDIDILFYGGLTRRRKDILGKLSASGLRVHYERSCWGLKRSELVARSRVVINVRGNDLEDGVFELVRVLPLLACGVAVLSEKGLGWESYAAGVKFFDDGNLVDQAHDAVAHWRSISKGALEVTRSNLQCDKLRQSGIEDISGGDRVPAHSQSADRRRAEEDENGGRDSEASSWDDGLGSDPCLSR